MLLKKLFCALLAISLSLVSWAMDEHSASGADLEEVVVSEFRIRSVLGLNTSVTAMNQQAIGEAALQNVEELIQLVPNMNFTGEGSRARYYQLRGIGELEQYEGAPNPSVGFIVDDIDLSGVGGISNLFDITRLEVLRGPQATRFGANAVAGMVYVQSSEPSDDASLNAELTFGNDETVAAGVAAGGALGNSINGRFSLHRYQSDGFYENVSLGTDDSNERDEWVSRGKLLWDLGRGWSVKLSGLLADFDNGYDSWSPLNERTAFSDNPGRDEQNTLGGSLKVTGPIAAGLDFVSITGYASSDILFSYDGDWGDDTYWLPYVYDYIYRDDRRRDMFSQEFRVLSSPDGRVFHGSTDWLIGVYAQKLDESNDILSSGIFDDSADAPFSYCQPCIDDTRLQSKYDSTNFAVFGQFDSDLSDRLSLSLGLRVERWDADYSDSFFDRVYGDPSQPVQHDFHPSKTLWGGNLSLGYEWSDTTRLYALVSRGYKAGGFNPSLARVLGGTDGTGVVSIAFEPEQLWNYEAGIKGQWLDHRLLGELSVFYMDRRNMQLRSSAQFTNNPNDFVFITSNAQGHSFGLEGSIHWQLKPAWALHGSLGLLESEVDSYPLNREADIPGALVGRQFAHAAPYTFSLGASYHGPDGWMARLDYSGAGSFYFDFSHDDKSAARQIVNFRVGKQWRNWAVHTWVRNLLDERYHTRGFSFGLEPPFFERSRYTKLGDPRHYGITLSYRY